jgi:purine-binding chemotaxis protein CheW
MQDLLEPNPIETRTAPASARKAPSNIAASESLRAPPSVGAITAQPGEYLSFQLGGQDYGLPILEVKEIRSFETPTRISGAPPEILGVVNLRGVIVPVIDLRLMFGFKRADIGPLAVVIVLSLRTRTVGVVVDAVSDVVDVGPASLRPPPALRLAVTGCAPAITGLACLQSAAAGAATGPGAARSGWVADAGNAPARMVQLLSADQLASGLGGV